MKWVEAFALLYQHLPTEVQPDVFDALHFLPIKTKHDFLALDLVDHLDVTNSVSL